MDEQQALGILKERKKAVQSSNQLWPAEKQMQEFDALDVAIKATEKAIPKQAGRLPGGRYICPACKEPLKGWNYCTRCGQRIKF